MLTAAATWPQGKATGLGGNRFHTRANTLVFSLALAVGAAVCAAAAAERLPDAVRDALSRHPDVLGAAANARAAVEGYEQAAAGRFPTLDLRMGSGRETSDNSILSSAGIRSRTLTRQEASLTLRQNLFDGSQVRSEMERQNFRVDSARSRLSETADAVALRVAEAYLDTLRDQGLVRLAEENVARHEDLLEKTRLRFKSGVGQRADVEQAEARVALARSSLVGARGAVEDSAARYLRVVGRAPAGLVEPAAPKSLPPSLDSAKAEGAGNNYGVKAARSELSAAKVSVRSVQADLLPRVDLELSASRNRDLDGIIGPNNDNQAMLVMRYNLFRGGADQSRIREALERETAALEAVNNAQQTVEESVARAWAALATARDRISPLEAHVHAGARVLQAYRDQFELGRRTLLDLVNAENELYQARSSLLSGRMAERASEYRLLNAMGILVRALGLADEVAQLDPRSKQP